MTVKGCLVIAISLPFALAGLIMASVDVDRCMVHANLYANVTRQNIAHVKQMAAWVEEVKVKSGRLPTDRELSRCRPDIAFEDCLIEVSGEPYKLKHVSYGVPFTPLGFEEVIYKSENGITDRDYLTSPWAWRLLFIPKFLVDLLVGFAPIIFLRLVKLGRSAVSASK